MHKLYLILGTVFGGLGVVLGCVWRTWLKTAGRCRKPSALFKPACSTRCIMPLRCCLLVFCTNACQARSFHWAGGLFVAGIILFSGSLYLLAALKAANKVGLSGVGIITPIGGLLFIAGWMLLLMAFLKR